MFLNILRISASNVVKMFLRPVYTTANFGYGTDKNSTGTKK